MGILDGNNGCLQRFGWGLSPFSDVTTVYCRESFIFCSASSPLDCEWTMKEKGVGLRISPGGS